MEAALDSNGVGPSNNVDEEVAPSPAPSTEEPPANDPGPEQDTYADVDLLEASANGDADPTEVDGVGAKEDTLPDAAALAAPVESVEESPGEKKIVDDADINGVHPAGASDGILLSFEEEDSGGNAEDSAPPGNHANDFDLLGFSPAETPNPSPNAAPDVFGGGGDLLDNQAVEASPNAEPGHDLLGMEFGESDASNIVAQPSPESGVAADSEPQSLTAGQENEAGTSAPGAVVDNPPVDNAPVDNAPAVSSNPDPEPQNPSAKETESAREEVTETPALATEVDCVDESGATQEVDCVDESEATHPSENVHLNPVEAVDPLPAEEETVVTSVDSHAKDEMIGEADPDDGRATEASENDTAPVAADEEVIPLEKHENVAAAKHAYEEAKTLATEDAVSGENQQEVNESMANEEGEKVAPNAGEPGAGEQAGELEEGPAPATFTGQVGVDTNHVETINEEVNAVRHETTEVPAQEPTPQQDLQIDAENNLAPGNTNEVAEERTEEEEEWLSMGLGLGDALRQIVALTEERDSALAMCKERDDGKTQAEALLVEVQSRLEAEMNRRAESDSEVRKVRETLKAYEERLTGYETMEDDLEKAQASLVAVVTEKSKIELEVQKLRELRDESAQKEVVLSNRLNEAKKKEANKSTAAGRLETDNEKLREDLQNTKEELESLSKAKAKLESNMEKLKAKAVERVKQAETALAEERELNEERKKKMKAFVENKADELREAKDSANDMQKELEETRASLRSTRDREEAFQKELEAARIKYRELQRDMERIKRNSEELHKMAAASEQELEKSASETEEHKKKRMSAKHEIMQMVRTLEAERTVSSKLRESVKFTFTPKALSQQELLNECLRDFEVELERLAAKTGKTLLPSAESSAQARDAHTDGGDAPEINGSSKKSKKTRASKADMDTERLISNLEQETQHVSKGIMALSGSIERMRSLLSDDNMFGCMTYLSNILLASTGEARHQRLGDSDAHEETDNNADRFV